MARGGVRRTPFAAVRALGAWAALNAGYIRGRLRLAGSATPTLRDVVDVAYVLICDGFVSDGVNGLRALEELRGKVDEAIMATWIDRATWGMDVSTIDSIPRAAPRAGQDGRRGG